MSIETRGGEHIHTFESHAGRSSVYNRELNNTLAAATAIMRNPDVELSRTYRSALRFTLGQGINQDLGPIEPRVHDKLAALMSRACALAADTAEHPVRTGLLAFGPGSTAQAFSGWHADMYLDQMVTGGRLVFEPTVLEDPRSVIALTGHGTLTIDGTITIPHSQLRLVQTIPGIANDTLVTSTQASQVLASLIRGATTGLSDMRGNLISWPAGQNPPGQYSVAEASPGFLTTMQPGTTHATHPAEITNNTRVFAAFN